MYTRIAYSSIDFCSMSVILASCLQYDSKVSFCFTETRFLLQWHTQIYQKGDEIKPTYSLRQQEIS